MQEHDASRGSTWMRSRNFNEVLGAESVWQSVDPPSGADTGVDNRGGRLIKTAREQRSGPSRLGRRRGEHAEVVVARLLGSNSTGRLRSLLGDFR
jgi:hypothetical protein